MKTLILWSKVSILSLILLSVFLFSCEPDKEYPNNEIMQAEQSITSSRNSAGLTGISSGCDCTTILSKDENGDFFADINKDGVISTIDLILIERILLALDYDEDGCLSYGTDDDLSDDVTLWALDNFNLPSNFPDLTFDGIIAYEDGVEAYFLLTGLSSITNVPGASDLFCQEHLTCLQDYLLGLICDD